MFKNVWLIFFIIFIFFGIYHFCRSKKNISKIVSKAQVKGINGLNLGIKDFIDDFNNYVDELNRDNYKINLWTSIAYITNALIALFSYLIS